LQKQGERYLPSEAVKARSLTPDFDALYQRSIQDPPAFWAEQAQELQWFAPWNEVMQWQESPPSVKWFLGAQCNITVNALDRHAKGARRNKVAFLWVSEPDAHGQSAGTRFDLRPVAASR
jgi:acetyl-CoA synthetase